MAQYGTQRQQAQWHWQPPQQPVADKTLGWEQQPQAQKHWQLFAASGCNSDHMIGKTGAAGAEATATATARTTSSYRA